MNRVEKSKEKYKQLFQLEISLITPWGILAFFYRDFGFANGLIKLGNIDFCQDLI